MYIKRVTLLTVLTVGMLLITPLFPIIAVEGETTQPPEEETVETTTEETTREIPIDTNQGEGETGTEGNPGETADPGTEGEPPGDTGATGTDGENPDDTTNSSYSRYASYYSSISNNCCRR